MASRKHVPKMDPLADRLDLFCTSREVPFVFMELELIFLEDVCRFCFCFRCLDGQANPGFTQGVGTELSWSTPRIALASADSLSAQTPHASN